VGPGYGNNADTFGGGTRVVRSAGVALRAGGLHHGVDLRSASRKLAGGLAIGYDDMEPFYTQAEYEIGVCGSAAVHAASEPAVAALPDGTDAAHCALPADWMIWLAALDGPR